MGLEQRHPVGGNEGQEIQELLDPEHPRKFLWIVPSPELHEPIVRALQASGMTVLDVIWPWHILACTPDASVQKRRDMVLTFLDSMRTEDPWLRGQMFGYPHADIDWYAVELQAAIDRARAYLDETAFGGRGTG